MNRIRKNLRRRKRVKNRWRASAHARPRLPINQHTQESVTLTKEGKLVIELPERLDFDENYEQTASCFAILRSAVRSGRTIRTLRFNKIEFISPSAALVLASEVDLWNEKVGRKLRANVDTWNEKIERLLCQMGYFELLKIRKPDTKWPPASTTFLPFKRGRIPKQDGGELAKTLRVEIEQIVGGPIKKHFLFEGLSEAITNVSQHAYAPDNKFALKQWWLSASFNSVDRQLRVMFYDQGQGIPKTLPKAYFFELIKEAFHTWTDSQKIEAAMETGRTSTGRSERGKGLQNLLEFAKSHREGQLSIYSLCGMYRQVFATNGGLQTSERMRRDHETSVGGTLIEWSVKL